MVKYLAATLCCAAVWGCLPADAGQHEGEWPVSTLEAEGIDPAPVATVVDHIQRGRYVAIDSLLIARNSRLVSEHYFTGYGPEDRHETRSTFKSIGGLLIGIAIGNGLLSLDDPVVPLIERYHALQDPDARKRRMTVSDLLQMKSGIDCSEMPHRGPERESTANRADDRVAANAEIPMADEPGTTWRYCSSNTFLLGIALKSALAKTGGGSLRAYLDARLMAPMGIGYNPAISPKGHFVLHGGEKMRPRDLAKVGQLLLSEGRWNGRQLVPADWVETILSDGVQTDWSWTSALSTEPAYQQNSTYRHQWFQTDLPVGDRTYRLVHSWGNGGQFIVVIAELELVVVTTGSNFGSGNLEGQLQIFEMLHKFILPAVGE